MTTSVASPFHRGEQEIQSRLGVREQIENVGQRFIRDHLPAEHRHFYEQLPMLIVGSIDDSGDEYVVDLRYVREGNPPSGTSDIFTAFYYEMTSTGRTVARNAKSVQTQGFWILAPVAL